MALAGTYLSLLLANDLKTNLDNFSFLGKNELVVNYDPPRVSAEQGEKKPALEQVQEKEPMVDTADWKLFRDNKLNLAFKYNPAWKIKAPVSKGGYQIIEIDPGKKYFNFKIYVNESGFYALDGLPAKSETIDGASALNVNDVLYGVKAEPFYYTFDIGYSLSLKPQFKALMNSVVFEE